LRSHHAFIYHGHQVARDVFDHLHRLELQFHLNRSTGAVSRYLPTYLPTYLYTSFYDPAVAFFIHVFMLLGHHSLLSLLSHHHHHHHYHSTTTATAYRVIDRGSRSINFVLSSLLFNIVPTALEISLVSYILASQCGWKHAA